MQPYVIRLMRLSEKPLLGYCDAYMPMEGSSAIVCLNFSATWGPKDSFLSFGGLWSLEGAFLTERYAENVSSLQGSRKNKNKIRSLRISCLHTFPVKMSCYPTCAHKLTKNITPIVITGLPSLGWAR